MGSSQTRARTCVPCIGRQILNLCTTREAPELYSFKKMISYLYLQPISSTLFFIHHQIYSLFQVRLLLFPALGVFIPTPTLLDVLRVSRGNLSFLLLLFQIFLRTLYSGVRPHDSLTYGTFTLRSLCSFHVEIYTLVICNCLLLSFLT